MSTPGRQGAFIEQIVKDARPVRRLWRPGVRLCVWLALEAAMLAALAAVGLRPDLAEKLRSPGSVLELAALLIAGGLTAGLALRAAVPGREPSRREGALALVTAAVATGLWLRQPAHIDLTLAHFIEVGVPCALKTLGLAALPWVALLIALRRGAPLAAGTAGTLAGGAALVVAFALMRLACPMDERLHLLVWHALPVVLGAGLSALLGLAWLPRWRHRSA